MSVAVRADRVDGVRDGNVLLDSVSLTVRSGEHWALLGANGAGKSTLLALLGAVSHPTRGTVEVLGRALGGLRELRAHLGQVDPRRPLRVRDVVLTGLTNSAEPVPRRSPAVEDLARADRLLEMLGTGGRGGARGQYARTRCCRAAAGVPAHARRRADDRSGQHVLRPPRADRPYGRPVDRTGGAGHGDGGVAPGSSSSS